ncbi:MAG: phytoene/squalene synthase family protein [Planctomycetaceae bacterium]
MIASAADHEACAAVLRASGSNFALPIRLLPAAKRRGTTAIYAFCRRADDAVDDAADPAAARTGLDAFERTVNDGLAGRAVEDPVVRALADTVRRFAVPPECIRDVLDGVRMDLDRPSYDTFAELEDYCRRVAGAVGIAAIHVWGFTSPEAIATSHDCGLAFQLTNILRDVPEDLARGRIYIPAEDFAAAGCLAGDLRAARIGPEFARLAALECDRAAAAYDRAADLDRMLTTDGRIAFRAMFGAYRALFAGVRRAGPRIFTTRPRRSRAAVIGAVASTLVLGTRRRRRR